MSKKKLLAIGIPVWLVAAALVAFGTVKLAQHEKHVSAKHAASAKATGAQLSQPVAIVAGAAMAWAYNSTPGTKVERLLACAEDGHTDAYRCVAIVDANGTEKCAAMAFTLSIAGKLAMVSAGAIENKTCGI